MDICSFVKWFGNESSEMIKGNDIVKNVLKGVFTTGSTNLILYITLPLESIAEITLKLHNLSLILSFSLYIVIFNLLYYKSIYNNYKDFLNTLSANLIQLGLSYFYVLTQIYP